MEANGVDTDDFGLPFPKEDDEENRCSAKVSGAVDEDPASAGEAIASSSLGLLVGIAKRCANPPAAAGGAGVVSGEVTGLSAEVAGAGVEIKRFAYPSTGGAESAAPSFCTASRGLFVIFILAPSTAAAGVDEAFARASA